jgi:hypothetical protein
MEDGLRRERERLGAERAGRKPSFGEVGNGVDFVLD